LHSRGNFDGFTRSATKDKWLEVHGIEHWTEFYTDYGVKIQKQFFDYYLKDIQNGWNDRPRVNLLTRYPNEVFKENYYSSWPLENTDWKKAYLDASNQSLNIQNGTESNISYKGFSEGITFLAPPVESETQITGPISLKLYISSDTIDADIFAVLRVFDEELKEVTFQGAIDPHTPVSQGWLRASHRKLDPELSKEYQPYHSHDEIQPLVEGEIYELDIEIWATSIVMPKNYRLALSIRGKDYAWPGGEVKGLGNLDAVFTGVGPFKHGNEKDRPEAIFNGNITLYTGGKFQSYMLLPYIK
jgi:predicted acyl esterase